MKNFEEIKKGVVDAKNKTVAFCKNHKECIKRAGCFAAGVALAVIFEEKRWDDDGLECKINAVTFRDGSTGYLERTFDKNGKVIKRFTTKVRFDHTGEGIELARELLQHAHIARGETGKYTWCPNDKE